MEINRNGYECKLLNREFFSRITIPLAFSIGFIAAIAPYLMTGPLFPIYQYGVVGCEKYGWLNVLYLNIYQDFIKPNTPQVSSILFMVNDNSRKIFFNQKFPVLYTIPTSYFSALDRHGIYHVICSSIGSHR